MTSGEAADKPQMLDVDGMESVMSCQVSPPSSVRRKVPLTLPLKPISYVANSLLRKWGELVETVCHVSPPS